MIISSERKFNTCPKCNGTGSISTPSALPWMPDDSSSCPKCHGSKKIETQDSDYDSNIFNIDNIVTVGEISMTESEYGFETIEVHTAFFYINGHIRVARSAEFEKPQHSIGGPKLEETKEKAYNAVKKIRDELIEKLQKNN